MDNLIPCPRCGRAGHLLHDDSSPYGEYWVCCTADGCGVPTFSFPTAEAAISYWNRRANLVGGGNVDNLIPCPLCGYFARTFHDRSSNFERNWRWGVECYNIGKCEAVVSGFDTKESAIAHWNRRADETRILVAFYHAVFDRIYAGEDASAAMVQELAKRGIGVPG